MKKMVITIEILTVPVSFISFHEFVKLVSRHKLDNLGEYIFAMIHNPYVLKQHGPINHFQIKKSNLFLI